MADQVTISTFLELHDKLTPGITRAQNALNHLIAKAQHFNTMMTKMSSVAKQAGDSVKAIGSHSAALGNTQRNIGGMAKQLNAATKNAERLASALAHVRAPKGAATPTVPRRGFFGPAVGANLVTDVIESGASAALRAAKFIFSTVISEGKKYEMTIQRIALSLNSLDMAPSMQSAIGESKALYSTLRDMAAKLPGETEDYVRVFAQGLPDAISRGMRDTQKYAEFVSKYTAFAISRNVTSIRAATDLEQILQGRARITTRTFAELRPHIGMASKEFNELMRKNPAEAMKVLLAGVDKSTRGMSEAANTIDAKYGELKSKLQEIVQIGGEPMFEQVKATISDINAWLSDNKQLIMDTAKIVSTTLGDAFRGLFPIVTEFGKRFLGVFKDIADFVESSPAMYQFLNFLSFQTLDIGRTAKELGRTKREAKETQESLDILKKYSALSGVHPGSVYTKREYEDVMKTYWRATQYAMKTGQGEKIFESKEDWDKYARAAGLDPMKLWKEMLKEGTVTPETLHPVPAERADRVINFNNNRFDIKQEFKEGFDPDRIAVAFATDLARVGELKLQSNVAGMGNVQ